MEYAEILYCTPKGRRALLRIPSMEGRSVCLCWAKSKPKGPQGAGGGLLEQWNPERPNCEFFWCQKLAGGPLFCIKTKK